MNDGWSAESMSKGLKSFAEALESLGILIMVAMAALSHPGIRRIVGLC